MAYISNNVTLYSPQVTNIQFVLVLACANSPGLIAYIAEMSETTTLDRCTTGVATLFYDEYGQQKWNMEKTLTKIENQN